MKTSVIHRALVAAFNGAPLSRGELLTSSYSGTEAIPLLVWQVGQIKTDPWTSDSYHVTWTIPAKLTVRSEQSNPTRLLEVVSDVQDWCGAVTGIPIDDDNNIVPRFSDQLAMFRDGKVKTIAERFSGPYVQSVAMPTGTTSDIYTADFVFVLDFIIGYPKTEEFTVKQFVLGIQPMDPNYQSIGYDPNKPFRLQIPLATDSDVFSRTPYLDPDTALKTANGDRVYGSSPPLLRDYDALSGVDPATTLVRMDVIPGACTLTSGAPTKKLDAIGYYMDGGTTRLDALAAWVSGTPAAATVASNGLVTRVAPGSTVITASYNGLSATSLVTVS